MKNEFIFSARDLHEIHPSSESWKIKKKKQNLSKL